MNTEYVQVLVEGDLRTLKKQIKVLGSKPHAQISTVAGREVELNFCVSSLGYQREGHLWTPKRFEEADSEMLNAFQLVMVIRMDSLKGAEAQLIKLRDTANVRSRIIAVTDAKVFNEPGVQNLIYQQGRDLGMAVYVESPEEFTLDELKSNLRVWIPAWSERERSASSEPHELANHPPYLKLTKALSDPETGRLDARKLAAELGLTLQETGATCGVTKQSIHANPTSKNIQKHLHVLEQIARGLLWSGDDKAKFKSWLNRPNSDFPEYEGKQLSPLDMIRMGHAQVVADKVQNLLTGHPS